MRFLTLKWLIRAADGGGKQTLPVMLLVTATRGGESAGFETRPPDVVVSLEIGQSIPLMLDKRRVYAVSSSHFSYITVMM